MATSSNPRTPIREPKMKRDTGLDIFGLGSDDDDFYTPRRVTRKARPTTPLTPRSPNAAASPCRPKSTASKGKKRKKPTVSKAKGKKKIRHAYRAVAKEYAKVTTERFFREGHIAIGSFSCNHPQFAGKAAVFNTVIVNGKPVWQMQPSGPSTLHNSIVIADYFPSLAPFLKQLEGLCKPRPTTNRLFLKQRGQQYTTSGQRHRDGKNGPWRMCITAHDPAAPPHTKRLKVGLADPHQREGWRHLKPMAALRRRQTGLRAVQLYSWIVPNSR
ncbi:unnamed protein product [Ectocarpus sp. 12 AP-2014]